VIAVVVGPDAFLVNEAVTRLATEHDPDGSSTTRFDGRDTSVAEIAAAAGSLGFFGSGRVILVTDLLARAAKGATANGGDDDAVADTKRPPLDLAPLLAAVAPANLLILADASLTTVPAAVKRLLPPNATIVQGDPPRGSALLAWVERTATTAGGAIDRRTAQLLVESLFPQTWSAKPNNPRYDRPPDLEQLRNEIDKLILAAHPNPVSANVVRAMTGSVPDDRVFRFVDAAAAGDLGTAMGELDRLLRAGEEPAKLVAQLNQHAELVAVAEAARGRDPVSVGRDLGLSNPQRMAGVVASLRRGRRGAAASLEAALETDRGFKSGHLRQPIDALHDQIDGFAGPPSTSTNETGGH